MCKFCQYDCNSVCNISKLRFRIAFRFNYYCYLYILFGVRYLFLFINNLLYTYTDMHVYIHTVQILYCKLIPKEMFKGIYIAKISGLNIQASHLLELLNDYKMHV